MTADADRPSAGNVALVRKYLEKHGVTSTEDGRIVIATLLEKVSKKHDDFCNEMAERIEAATASQRKRIDALTAREAALLSQVATLREALDKSYNGPEADLPRTVERLLHNTAEAAARRDEAIRAEADAATDEVIALACESVGVPRRKGDPYEVLTVAFEAIRASERERCAKVADDAYEKWKANADRPQSEHSGPSYAAAVAGEAASRDIAAAIRALSPGTADAGER